MHNDFHRAIASLIPVVETLERLEEPYYIGGCTSERQWADVQGVLKVQSDRLDRSYMDEWAQALGLHDLLRKARNEASSLWNA